MLKAIFSRSLLLFLQLLIIGPGKLQAINILE